MKTRYVVLFFLSFILFTNISCDEDDNNNDNDPDQVEFTSTNYIYEGDLRKYYLETKNTELQTQIEVWQQVPDNDPGYNDAQESIEAANNEIEDNNIESFSIVSPANAFIIINPIPPLPPPLPCLCLDVYNVIDKFVFQPGNDQGGVTITAVEDQSILVSTNPNSPVNTIMDTNGLGRYQSFELAQENFTGQAVINVQTDNGSYSILANFQGL